MKALILTLSLITISTAAHAGDSAWLSCKSKNLVVNVFEHRGANIYNRDTDFTVTYGGHVLSGTITNPATVLVLEGSASDSMSAAIRVNYVKNQVSIKGDLDVNGTTIKVSQKMTCTRMESL